MSKRNDIVEFCRNYNKDIELEFERNETRNLIVITFPTYGRDQIPSLITVDLALRTVVLFTDSDEEKNLACALSNFYKLDMMH
jgi:hypothetical protein